MADKFRLSLSVPVYLPMSSDARPANKRERLVRGEICLPLSEPLLSPGLLHLRDSKAIQSPILSPRKSRLEPGRGATNPSNFAARSWLTALSRFLGRHK